MSAGNAASTEITHVSTSFTLKPITFCGESSKMDTSPITISSLAKENSKVSTNPRVLQDEIQVQKAKEEASKVEAKTKEGTEEVEERYAKLDMRIKALEEGFFTFSKFGLKVIHSLATGITKGGYRYGYGGS